MVSRRKHFIGMFVLVSSVTDSVKVMDKGLGGGARG